ncbi:MAG UNVERIFIED_CONTAM: Ppx/GppA family phosphatase [Rickettsiaceae bacterium]|jgi:exopolyphosphatase/guanosine-5'-triphosphate,3'-diphosphate pyrophosphatase
MRHAIIDIGSNAIRAVIYENNTLSASEVYNEKFRSDLVGLLDLADLNVKHSVYLVVQHFVHIFKQLNVGTVKCVATAVLRNHINSPAFVKIIKERYDIDIEIIPGEKEAYLTAAGLIMGIARAEGLVADLGGGSLELAEIKNKEVGRRQSLALGTNIIDLSISVEEVKRTISGSFECLQYPNLYLIGGAFRMLGRAYMEFVKYPLKNLHNLRISSEEFLTFLVKYEESYADEILSYKRSTDTKASKILQAMIELFGIQNITISNYGLKEGVRFVNLPDKERHKDIVRTRCEYLSDIKAKGCKLDKYYEMIEPLLLSPDEVLREVVELTIMLSCININIDKTMRAHFMADFAISSDIPFTHKQRIMMAVALSYIFGYKPDLNIERLSRRMLTKDEYHNGQIIGSIIRIAYEVDGPMLYKPSFKLILKDRYIEIDAGEVLPRPVFDKICDRLKDIAIARRTRNY